MKMNDVKEEYTSGSLVNTNETKESVKISANDKTVTFTVEIDRKYYDFFKYKANYEETKVGELVVNAIKNSANNAKQYKDRRN